MSDERRDTERLSMLGDVRGEITVVQPVTLLELSRTGASITSPVPLQLNSLHELRLSLGTSSIVVKARVVHSRIRDLEQDGVVYQNGVEFVEASDRVLDAIDRFIDMVRAHRGGA